MWKHKKMAEERVDVNVVEGSCAETPWRSVFTVSIFSFCTMAQFTLYFTSLWPYLQTVDSTITETFYGVIIASYSLGQILFGPVISFWATRTKSIVAPAQCCLFISLIGNVIYIASSVLSSNQKWCVLVGRFLVGMSESSLSLYQTFTSTASTQQDRSKALSVTTGGLALGYSVGPALQLIFTPFHYPGYQIVGNLRVNMYTSPAIVSCIMNIVCIIVLRVLFVERYAGLANSNTDNSADKKVHVPKFDKVAVGVCHLSRFVQLFVFTNLETIGTPFMMTMFALRSTTVVKDLSIAHSIAGFCGFLFYMFHAFRKEIIDYRKLLILSFGGFILFHVLTIPLPYNTGHLKTYSAQDYAAYKLGNSSGIEPVGCPVDKLSWCHTTGATNFWVFIIAMIFVMGVFWPNVNVSLSTQLSKILGPRRQAHQQSIFQISASFARLIGPILVSNVYTAIGPMYTWIFEIIILVFIIIVWLVVYRRMVPLQISETSSMGSEGSVSSVETVEEELRF